MRATFFEQLDRAIEVFYSSPFFAECDEYDALAKAEIKRLERVRAKREANAPKALHLLKRLHKVQAIDLFAMTRHIEPDWFGDKGEQWAKVKKLYDKKARIVWYLQAAYTYYAFDVKSPNWRRKYSQHRKVWAKMLRDHRENLKQAKWDLKREKVRRRKSGKRYEKEDKALRTLYKLKYGTGTQPPV